MPPGSRRAFTLGIILIVSLIATLSWTACGGDPPEREMEQAQTAIDDARAAGADKYAPLELTAAEDALKNARAAVDQRDYRLALNHALDSRERAQNAAKQAAEAGAAQRTAADRAVSAATTALGTAERLMRTAERARVAAKILANARPSVAAAASRVQEARAARARGDYLAASAAATSVTEQLQPIIADLSAATAPPSRRRR
jgi:uncharacterized protein DUF4398